MFSLHNTQKQVAIDPHRFRILCCGRRWGKTTLAIDQMKGRAAIPNSRIAYVAPTYQQARDIAWEQLKTDCRQAAESINEARLEIKLVNGSLIVLRGWEAIETLRGQKFDLIVLDEVAMMRNYWVSWQEVIRPTLTDTKGEALFISTPKGFNHFYDLFNFQDKDKDFKSFHFTTYDNPHIPKDEVDKAKLELTEDRFAQEYLADFRKTQGLVYKEFIREKHVYSSEMGSLNYKVFNSIERLVGIDWGFTNPAAIYLIERDTDNAFYISREYYKTQKTTPELIEYLGTLNGNKFYPDPAEPDRNEEMRRAGFIPRDVSKDVEAGINSVRELLKTNRLFIHSSCVNLISEFETYSYPDKKPDKNENEAPIKENDHALDAIRYVLYMQPKAANQQAYVHYSPSAMPTQNIPMTQRPKTAYTHVPRLRR